MSYNTFGRLFRVTSWGESHGPMIGCVIDGCPPRVKLSEADIQAYLDERKPGRSRFVTQRREADQVRIVSGVFDGMTTGTPISLIIENTDQRSRDYGDISTRYRPGHADYTYDRKYGIRDYRGGGRASARETACRVAAGAVARKVMAHLGASPPIIRGALAQIGDIAADRARWDWAVTRDNAFFAPDPEIVPLWEKQVDDVRKAGSSIGAVIEIVADSVPVGLGAPVSAKLDADLAHAMMGINGVKAVEIGDGFAVAALRGEENADPMRQENGKTVFESNHAGGILGGISSGQPIIVRFAIKPTSSILIPVPSITRDGEHIEVATKGRHDPCIGIRAVPVGEAMMACVLLDHMLMDHAQHHGGRGRDLPPDQP
ncbi:Chorismate synthase [Acetobacteraceae bacterium EV16G]|uniref:Chorismate synthase n=1 Tax=Sorlinia euscelidii TaxID=3081148 RepID=A0ABU7U5K0_9PROT